jgi:hypothetical protein
MLNNYDEGAVLSLSMLLAHLIKRLLFVLFAALCITPVHPTSQMCAY